MIHPCFLHTRLLYNSLNVSIYTLYANIGKAMLNVISSSIPDHRLIRRCTYPLSDLLTIALLTYLCGGEDYVDMSEFSSEHVTSGCLRAAR